MNEYDYNYNYESIDDNITDRYHKSNMIPNYMQTDMLSNLNYIPNIDKAQVKMTTNQSPIDVYQGFIKGNLFGDLYEPYKGYKPSEVNPSNEREALLEQWQQYSFALVDLNLYLDVYPNDKDALNLFNKYAEIKREITDKYEKMYGPLTIDGEMTASSWNWIKSPWPWEVIK